MRLDEIAAPIQNRDRDDLLVFLGPGGTGVHQGARAGARDELDVPRQLHRGSVGGERKGEQYGKRKQVKPNTHVIISPVVRSS